MIKEKMKSDGDRGIDKQGTMENPQNEKGQQNKQDQSTALKIGRLQQQIGDMRKEVEELLKQKDRTNDKVTLEKINKEKKEKIKVLKRLAKKLREVYKDTKKERELKSVGNVLDGIAFHKAKKDKRGEGMPKVRKIRAAREAARNRYLGYLSMESKYYKLDPPEVPGCLFLHDKIINTYGLIHEELLRLNTELISDGDGESANSEMKSVGEQSVERNAEVQEQSDNNVGDYTQMIREGRLEWLRSKEDGGKFYFEMYDQIFGREEYKKLEGKKAELEERIDGMIRESLTESQLEMYSKSFEFIGVWAGTNIKTKRMKERFKLLLHALATLKSETCLPIVEYFRARYKTDIITNDYELQLTLKNKNIYAIDLVGRMVDELKGVNEEIEMKKKFWENNNKYLKNELYMYLTGEKVFRDPTPTKNDKSDNLKQTGKYFIRWIKLTVEEQGERFESYARWYIEKFLIGKGLIEAERRLEMVSKLATLLHESYKVKHMIYRDFAWKTKSGMIETVKILQYDKDKEEFILKFSKKPKVVVVDPKKAEARAKKKAGKESSIFDEGQRVNDILLRYIIDNKSHLQIEDEEKSKVHKNKCLDTIKKDFKIKSMSALDRQRLFVKYTDMCHDIKRGLEEFMEGSMANKIGNSTDK